MILSVENGRFAYPGGRPVLKDICFEAGSGDLVAILGPNGCGKSTLLRTLAGLQQPLGGECRFSFSEAFQQRSDLAARRSKYIALVLTERLSVDSATVRDVVAMGRYPYTSFLGTLTAADSRIVNEAMQQVDVLDLADTFYNDHSDGEKQRILIAKALAQQTPVILLDEPTAHLDLPSRIKTLNLLRSIAHEQNKTILISTHELDLALRTADRVLLMYTKNEGIAIDTPQNLIHADAFTKAFGMEIRVALD